MFLRLHFVEMLGEGAFGEVWKAVLRISNARTATNQGEMREEEVTDALIELFQNSTFYLILLFEFFYRNKIHHVFGSALIVGSSQKIESISS